MFIKPHILVSVVLETEYFFQVSSSLYYKQNSLHLGTKTLNENKYLLWAMVQCTILRWKQIPLKALFLHDLSAEDLCVISLSIVKFLK